jgi:probable F420-dependent oxidoreductase
MSLGLLTSRSRLRTVDAGAAAAQVEALGFDTLWVADPREDLPLLDEVLAATTTLRAATAVLSVWAPPAGAVADWWSVLPEQQQERVLLGLGVSHAVLVPQYEKPMAAMTAYLDRLDAAGVPSAARVLGANGPRMVELAGRRAAGTLTYLTMPERTAAQRAALGPRPRIAAEVKVVVTDDRAEGRSLARAHLATYLGLPNYLGNLRTMGFTDEDLTPPGSDRLVDALVLQGAAAALARAAEHRAAGADAIALHALSATGLPHDAWRELAAQAGAA